jgi:hypothetical protein
MAVIGFSNNPDEIWYRPGWAFRQVLDDVMSQYPEDSEMADEFDLAKIYKALNIDLMEPEFAARVTIAIRQVVTGILSGAIRSGIYDQPYGDEVTVEQYLRGLQELLEILEAFPATLDGGRIWSEDRRAE